MTIELLGHGNKLLASVKGSIWLACKIGGFQNGTCVIGAIEGRAGKIGTFEMGLGEIEATEIHARELGVDEVGGQIGVGGPPFVPLTGAELCKVVRIGHLPFRFLSSIFSDLRDSAVIIAPE